MIESASINEFGLITITLTEKSLADGRRLYEWSNWLSITFIWNSVDEMNYTYYVVS